MRTYAQLLGLAIILGLMMPAIALISSLVGTVMVTLFGDSSATDVLATIDAFVLNNVALVFTVVAVGAFVYLVFDHRRHPTRPF